MIFIYLECFKIDLNRGKYHADTGIQFNKLLKVVVSKGGQGDVPYPCIIWGANTVVGDYINTMKTTFDLNYDLYQAFKQHGYTK